MPIAHVFVSAKADGPDATLVRPSDWNADHSGDAGHTVQDETTPLAQRTNLRFRGTGIKAYDAGVTPDATDIFAAPYYDAIVDDTEPGADQGNIYSTLQAAITAGHTSIFVRHMADTVDITIAAGDAVTRIIGEESSNVQSTVNITVEKTSAQIEYLQFNNKNLILAAAYNVAFACVFVGTARLELRATDQQPIQCRFVGCTTTPLIIDGENYTCTRPRITSNVFLGNSGPSCIEIKSLGGVGNRPASGLMTSNLFAANVCTGFLVGCTSVAAIPTGARGWQIAGNLFHTFDNGCLQVRGSLWNIAGNTFDGGTKLASVAQKAIYWIRNGQGEAYNLNMISGNVISNCNTVYRNVCPVLEGFGLLFANNFLSNCTTIYGWGYVFWASNVYKAITYFDFQSVGSQTILGGMLIGGITFQNVPADLKSLGWPLGDYGTWYPAVDGGMDVGSATKRFASLRLFPYTDATRPAAATAGAGAVIYNSTDSGLNVSDGTNWRMPVGGWAVT